MMNNPRVFLWIALAAILVLNYQAWTHDYGAIDATPAASSGKNAAPPGGSLDQAVPQTFSTDTTKAASATHPVTALQSEYSLWERNLEPQIIPLLRELRALQAGARSEGRTLVPRLPFARLTARAGRADRMAKGLARGDPWDELALLAVELCGLRTLPLLRAG